MRDDNKPMLQIKAKELTENLRRLAKKAGIKTYGKRVRFHCLRKWLIDRISLEMSESKWKQIFGKQINEKAYVSPLKLREAYNKVMPHIQITAEKVEGLTEDEIRTLKRMLSSWKEGKIKIKERGEK